MKPILRLSLLIIGALACFAPDARPQQPAPVAAASASASIVGIWLGTLQAGPIKLRVQLRVVQAASGSFACSLDSIDQKVFGIACSDIQVQGIDVSFAVPAVRGHWTGTLSADGKTLTGLWTQGSSLVLIMQRQDSAIEPPRSALPDPAMPPVPVEGLKQVLDEDLAAAFKDGALAPGTGAGITIGVVQHGERRILTYGTAKPDSVFEIGSITKTFTGLILAQMVQQGKVRLDTPVRSLLPPHTVDKPALGAGEITLLDLSDQHSGLPKMPDNFHPADPANPYADYHPNLLYTFIAKQGVALPPDAPFGYSNVGVGLLGQALANKAGVSYATLLRQQVTGPLGLHNTGIVLTPEMKARLIQGYDAAHKPARPWDHDAFTGSGGIRSTASDMLTYLQAQLHPDHLPLTARTTLSGKTLPAAITASHVLHAHADDGMQIALNWLRTDETGNYWHNGATGGYSAYALFNPARDFAVVVLSNTSAGQQSFTDKLGQHIAQRLTGAEAVSLAP